MANSTDPFAESVHGTNPQYLVEKITRLKIYNCRYWKESCFGLTSETIVDKAISLKYCGGTYGGSNKPSDFICLVLKLLQLQPELDIAIEFIRNEDFKYLRVLGAFYIRLVAKPEEIFRYLEPLYEDFRKIAYRGMAGWSCKYMDEFIDSLLVEELVCDIALPHLPKRMKLEQLGILQERTSILDSELFNGDDKEPTANTVAAKVLKSTVLDSTVLVAKEEKRNTNGDITTGNEEYINEYRKDDVRSRRAGLQDNEDADHKKRESDRRRESSSDRRGDRRNRSREPRSRDRNDAESNRYTGRGRERDRRDDSQKSEVRTASRSPETTKVVKKRESSHSRSRERERRGDRNRESRHHSNRDRDRSRSHDGRRRSRSRSTGRSRKSDYSRGDRNTGSSRYRVRDRNYERDDDRGGRRRRERSRSDDERRDRKSRGSRYRSRSRSHSEGRRRSRVSSNERSKRRSRRSRSSSTSSSNSRSSSSSSSESEKEKEKEKDTIKSSAPTSSSRKQEEENSDTEDSKIISNAADEKAAAAKAAKAEKKFDKMFKTKKSGNGEDSKASSGAGVKAHPEGSVEYWNQIREGLGIKKLKQ